MAFTLTWDGTGEKRYENGVDRGVLYLKTGQTAGKEWEGVEWNGLTSVSETPEGGDANDLYADNIKYATLRGAETFGGTIEAYTFPDAFMACDGSKSPASIAGMSIGQQTRAPFRCCYRTNVGSDDPTTAGYKLHLVYGATCSPSERSYETVNDSPDAITFSWSFDTTPVAFTTNAANFKPTSLIVIDSTQFTTNAQQAKLAALEAALYGDGTTTPYMPDPEGVITLLTPSGG